MNETTKAMILATACAMTVACTTTAPREDEAPVEGSTASSAVETGDEAAEKNYLLTGTTIGDNDIDGKYELEKSQDFYSVMLDDGVEGISLSGEGLCEVNITNEKYRTATGAGVGAKKAEWLEGATEVTFEEATGMIWFAYGEDGMAVEFEGMPNGIDEITPETRALMIRLGGCGE